MNNKEMVKMINERFGIPSSYERIKDDVYVEDIKEFIFETIIPEVLESIDVFKLNEQNKNLTAYGDGYEQAITDCNNHIKQKAKELYGIDL